MTEKNDLGIGYSNKNKEWRLAFNMKDPYKLTFLKISLKLKDEPSRLKEMTEMQL